MRRQCAGLWEAAEELMFFVTRRHLLTKRPFYIELDIPIFGMPKHVPVYHHSFPPVANADCRSLLLLPFATPFTSVSVLPTTVRLQKSYPRVCSRLRC